MECNVIELNWILKLNCIREFPEMEIMKPDPWNLAMQPRNGELIFEMVKWRRSIDWCHCNSIGRRRSRKQMTDASGPSWPLLGRAWPWTIGNNAETNQPGRLSVSLRDRSWIVVNRHGHASRSQSASRNAGPSWTFYSRHVTRSDLFASIIQPITLTNLFFQSFYLYHSIYIIYSIT